MALKVEPTNQDWENLFKLLESGAKMRAAVDVAFAGIARISWVRREIAKSPDLKHRHDIALKRGMDNREPRVSPVRVLLSKDPKTKSELERFDKYTKLLEQAGLLAKKENKSLVDIRRDMGIPDDWRWLGVVYHDVKFRPID